MMHYLVRAWERLAIEYDEEGVEGGQFTRRVTRYKKVVRRTAAWEAACACRRFYPWRAPNAFRESEFMRLQFEMMKNSLQSRVQSSSFFPYKFEGPK